MKKTYLILLALAAIVFASCGGHSPQKLSEKEILKQCNKSLVETGSDSAIVIIQTGYYEVGNENERCTLEKLQAAGVVDYQVERFAWWEKKTEKKKVPHTVTRYYWGYPYTDTEYVTKWVTKYEFNEHFMANVTLTDAAKKYELSHLPMSKEKDLNDPDLVQPEYDPNLFPENQVTCEENWPEIPHPLANEVYKQCKAILADAENLLNDSYSKAEQKLNSIYRIDNFDCMTTAQTAEINSEIARLSSLIEQKKGDEAYEKCKNIIKEASDLLKDAKDCKGINKTENKLSNVNYVSNNQLMSETQKSDITNLINNLSDLIENKKQEFGCNPVEPKPVEEVEEERPVDDRDPIAIAYENAKDNESKEQTILFAYIKKAIRARNISLNNSEEGTQALAEIIYQITKVTDAERVLEGGINNYRIRGIASFTYYCDKGWVLEDQD